MATRDGKITSNDDATGKVVWEGLLNGDVGAGVAVGRFPDKTAQVVGTFGTGGDLHLEGSNDGGTTWGQLGDAQGTLLSIQDTAPKTVGESPLLIRPNVDAGDGTTDLDVHLSFVKRGL